MESLLKNLKKHLECSICLDTYNEPKTISCLHTFCCQCLENHARASHRQGKFRCPECQAQIDLPEGNRFESLPSSFFHNSLLSLLAVRRTGDGSNITCSPAMQEKQLPDVLLLWLWTIYVPRLLQRTRNAEWVVRRTQSHASQGLWSRRLRSLAEATTILFTAVPRERNDAILLLFVMFRAKLVFATFA